MGSPTWETSSPSPICILEKIARLSFCSSVSAPSPQAAWPGRTTGPEYWSGGRGDDGGARLIKECGEGRRGT